LYIAHIPVESIAVDSLMLRGAFLRSIQPSFSLSSSLQTCSRLRGVFLPRWTMQQQQQRVFSTGNVNKALAAAIRGLDTWDPDNLEPGRVTVHNLQKRVDVDIDLLKKQALSVLKIMELEQYDLSISLVTEARMRELNFKFRNVSKSTDILSLDYNHNDGWNAVQFAPDGGMEDYTISKLENRDPVKRVVGMPPPPTEFGEYDLGDVIMCMPFIKRVCKKQDKEISEHTAMLLIHSVCHLLRYDHETDHAYRTMHARERQVMTALKKVDLDCVRVPVYSSGSDFASDSSSSDDEAFGFGEEIEEGDTTTKGVKV
jgi:probable rRNA maturation factor